MFPILYIRAGRCLSRNCRPQDPQELLKEIPDYDDNFTIEMIIQKILTDDKQYDLSKIISAYEFAAKAHEGQKRSSGQAYIIHPLAVAYILLELGMDTDTICAALLHDVVEDTPATLDDLKKRFGQGCCHAGGRCY